MSRRAVLAAIALAAVALPAAAYLPPAPAILRRVAQRRDGLGLAAIEVRGTLAFSGDAAQRAAAVTGLPSTGPELAIPAIVVLKVPGRCRLELAPDGVATGDRPAISMRGARVTGHRGLDGVPAARALVEGVCTLLGEKGAGGAEPERPLAQALAAKGVALGDVTLGRLSGRIAWVIGGRAQDTRPQAWVDKQSFQPARLVATLGGAQRDVRLLDFGSPVGGDAFPRAVEVWSGGRLEARFTIEKLVQNPRVPDAVF
ncbi:MAG TPA: hypothetical protein VF904_00875 [Anaeromyxobacteraceae bacterium]